MPALNDDMQTTENTDRRSGSWYAVFAKDVGSLTELAEVVIPEFDDQLRFGRARWMPRSDASYPDRGDKALVQFDNRGNLWVVAWWPFAS